MIKQYNDHAANERTYLAWLRTGIAVIAFGFVLERFSLFLDTITQSLGRAPGEKIPHSGYEAGVVLVAAGLITIATAIVRYAVTARKISSAETTDYSPRSAFWLGALIMGLGIFIFIYVARIVSPGN